LSLAQFVGRSTLRPLITYICFKYKAQDQVLATAFDQLEEKQHLAVSS